MRNYLLFRVAIAAMFFISIDQSAKAQPNAVNCQDWEVYLADILENDVTNIYEVTFDGQDANLHLIATSEIEVHIAFNDDDNLIYAISKADGSYRTINPFVESPEFSETQLIDVDVSGITAAAFTPEGSLLIGSSGADMIYEVDIESNSASVFIEDAPIEGGDIEFDVDGNLYIASRQDGGGLYDANDGSDEPFADLPSTVTGMALSNGNQLLISENDATSLLVRNLDGSEEVSLNLKLDGEPFLTTFGDMASGCNSFFIPNEGECELFSTYYMDNDPQNPTLYSLFYSGDDAVLTPVYESDFRAHIAFDAENNIIYLVNRNGNNIHLVDPELGFIGEVEISGDLNNAYAVEYNSVDGLLYIGDSNSEEIYTVDPTSGATTFYAENQVQGGDLAIQDGILYLAVRNAKDLYEIISPSEINLVGDLPSQVSGMARANNSSSLVISKANSNKFIELAANGSEIQQYKAVLASGAPFVLANGGDMAAGCADENQFEDCNYKLYYTHVASPGAERELYEITLNEEGGADIEYIDNLENAHIALSPDGSILYAVGSSNVITYQLGVGVINDQNIFNGANDQNLSGFPAAVCNSEGDLFIAGNGDNVWQLNPANGEATNIATNIPVYGGDLIVAPTGEDEAEELWLLNRTNNDFRRVLDPGNGAFAIDDAPEINGAAVLSNGNVLLANGDGDGEDGFLEVSLEEQAIVATYDVDLPLFNGDLAGRCVEVSDGSLDNQLLPESQIAHTGQVSSYPNPTTGVSQVVFETGSSAYTTLEVYDMSGRNVATLFNQVALAGQEYRADFDGSTLPNGIYIYRLTNDSETIIEKFMISR